MAEKVRIGFIGSGGIAVGHQLNESGATSRAGGCAVWRLTARDGVQPTVSGTA